MSEPLQGHMQDAFDVAERHALLMLGELRRRCSKDHAEEVFEQVVGVLVLMCVTKPGNNGPANINYVLADTPWRLASIQ
jgi:hypothetical protein